MPESSATAIARRSCVRPRCARAGSSCSHQRRRSLTAYDSSSALELRLGARDRAAAHRTAARRARADTVPHRRRRAARAPAATRLADPRRAPLGPLRGGVRAPLARRHRCRDAAPRAAQRRRLRGADVEAAIDLARIGADDRRRVLRASAIASADFPAPVGPQMMRSELSMRPNRRSISVQGSCTMVLRPCTSCAGSVVAASAMNSARISPGERISPALIAALHASVAASRSCARRDACIAIATQRIERLAQASLARRSADAASARCSRSACARRTPRSRIRAS